MADTVTVRVAHGRFWLDGEYLTTDDDPFEVREVVAETHPRTLERVDGEDDEDEGNPGEDSSTEEDLTNLDGVGEATAEKLREAGAESVTDVRGADPEALAEIGGISEDLAADLTGEE